MFDTFERSRFQGKPVRLFQFTRQAKVWRYAASPIDVPNGAFTYLSAQIDRDEIRQTAEPAKDKLKIRFAYLRKQDALELPVTQPLGDLWHPYPPSDTVRVMCMATHIGATDAPKVEWMGMVTQPVFSDTELELTCEPGYAISHALNQGAKWQRGCWKTPHSTGLRGCNMSPTDFAVTAAITAVAGLNITAAAFAAAPLSLEGGWVEWTDAEGIVESRSIMGHTGSTLRLLYGANNLPVGTTVTAQVGCPGTWTDCDARNNTVNYGGAIYMPVRDPNKDSMSWG